MAKYLAISSVMKLKSFIVVMIIKKKRVNRGFEVA